MASVEETIPEGLRAEVDAALRWFNERESERFEVTGILDPQESLATDGAKDLRLVLCGGDRCEQRSFRVLAGERGFEVTSLDEEAAAADAPQAELDPPPGANRGWLDRTMAQSGFVLLIFYRGFW